MAVASFDAADNEFIDYPTPSKSPVQWMVQPNAAKSPTFLDTYLAFRTPPRLRPNPRRPYACLDVLVADALAAGPRLTPLQLLDVALLFPASVAGALISRRAPELADPLRGLRKAVEDGEEDVADAVDVLLGVARAGGADALLDALSSRRDAAEALQCVHKWRLSIALADGGDGDFVVDAVGKLEKLLEAGGGRDGALSSSSKQPARADPVAEAEALVREMMPDAGAEAIRDALAATGNNPEAAVGLLLDEADGSAGLVPIGKRTERRRHVTKVDASETFTGERAEGDGGYGWLKARMDTEIARQATLDPDDPREEKRVGAYTFLLGGDDDGDEAAGMAEDDAGAGLSGMYDDDPDDAVLEGEEPLGKQGAARPAFLRSGVDAGSSTEEDSDGDDDVGRGVARGPSRGGAAPRGRAGSSAAPGGRGRGAPRGNGRGRGRGGGGDVGGGGTDGGRGRGRGGPGGVRGRGGRGRGGRGAHGRRDGAAKKQARAGM